MYLHYEEAHEQAFDRGDEDSKAIIRCLNSFMISEEHLAVHPLFPFDMHYFYRSLISVIGQFRGRTLRSGLDDLDKINGVNFPNLTNPEWEQYAFVTSGLAEKYIDEIRKSSTTDGSSFDVTFACTVASKSIDSRWLLAWQRPAEGIENDDFDQWLAGFNK